MFFSSWSDLARIFIISFGAYAGLIVVLRISGNRTLSKMNSFDLVVTVALGSAFASGILQKSITLSDVLAAFAALVGLQYAVTWLSVRSRTINELVKTEPTLVFRNGRFLQQAMRDVRITHDEIQSAIRKQGFSDFESVEAVVLESDGQLSAIGPIGGEVDRKDHRPSNELLPQS